MCATLNPTLHHGGTVARSRVPELLARGVREFAQDTLDGTRPPATPELPPSPFLGGGRGEGAGHDVSSGTRGHNDLTKAMCILSMCKHLLPHICSHITTNMLINVRQAEPHVAPWWHNCPVTCSRTLGSGSSGFRAGHFGRYHATCNSRAPAITLPWGRSGGGRPGTCAIMVQSRVQVGAHESHVVFVTGKNNIVYFYILWKC